ncbi:MAG: DNA cytosine methyltransferase, partial [Candidatus Sericytochromatia bacterium]|nr:DNA cytosine methyltransferase [Candidatus Tanganyikabacteria bacterium]
MRSVRGISLFSGIAGLDLGLKRAIPDLRVVAYVEQDADCQRVLRARIADGLLDDAPIFDDVRTFEWGAGADLVFGGFPCQDVSNAGKRAGIDGERSGLWSEFARIVGMVR